MRQILLLVVFVLAARWLVRTMRAAQTEGALRGGARPGTPRGAAGGTGQERAPRQLAEPMVCCAVCGVHAPKSDSIRAGAQYFCSAEHAQRYAARAGGREGR
ncbi:PP0621 family protein [Trinickia acidisoli]|uniref:PP0621 family protein n=1 Tax=Trinickia acidisoli TaxID=2767482 RepID=UPI001A8C7ED3|nr:PP0621 family protein [Trinickia acidisoli]